MKAINEATHRVTTRVYSGCASKRF